MARAWLISDLSEDDRIAAEGSLLMLLDDPSPLVRQAMAEVFSRSSDAPANKLTYRRRRCLARMRGAPRHT